MEQAIDLATRFVAPLQARSDKIVKHDRERDARPHRNGKHGSNDGDGSDRGDKKGKERDDTRDREGKHGNDDRSENRARANP